MGHEFFVFQGFLPYPAGAKILSKKKIKGPWSKPPAGPAEAPPEGTAWATAWAAPRGPPEGTAWALKPLSHCAFPVSQSIPSFL